jgi:hypothetical protein
MGVCLWSTACGETPTAASHDPPAPQFKKGGGKPPPPNLQGTPLDALFRDAAGDRLRSDGFGTYSSGTEDTFVLLNGGLIEFRLDQGGTRGFYVGPGTDTDHPTDVAFATVLDEACDGDPSPGGICTGKGLIGAFTLWRNGEKVGFPDVTDANSDPVTAEMTAAWEAGNHRWHLKYGQDCDYDAVIANRLTVTALPGPITGWAVETTGAEPMAYLCRIPQRGKRVAESMGEFVAPIQLEFRYQPNP